MVQITSQTFIQLFDSLSSQFVNTADATALLWWRIDNRQDMFGLRVEVPSLMREFSNGVELGKDPEGILFYHDIDDLSPGSNVKYDVYYNEGVIDTQRAFVIEFYHETPKRTIAQFLAKDINREVNYLVDGSSLNNQYALGAWGNLNSCTASAHIWKETSVDNTWTIAVPSVSKQVTFSSTAAGQEAINTWGLLTFKQLDQIDGGVWVDYRDDRIIFTDTNEWSGDFRAFFVPVETAKYKKPLGSYVFGSVSATWSAYNPSSEASTQPPSQPSNSQPADTTPFDLNPPKSNPFNVIDDGGGFFNSKPPIGVQDGGGFF